MEKFESFMEKIVIAPLFAGIATSIYIFIMDSWKSALLLFVAYEIVIWLIMLLSVIFYITKKINILFFIVSAMYIIFSIAASIIFVVVVCSLLWEYDGIFVGILCILNIGYGIFITTISLAIVAAMRDGIKQKQAELAEAKKKEQQEIIETAVKNALKEYKNMEK